MIDTLRITRLRTNGVDRVDDLRAELRQLLLILLGQQREPGRELGLGSRTWAGALADEQLGDLAAEDRGVDRLVYDESYRVLALAAMEDAVVRPCRGHTYHRNGRSGLAYARGCRARRLARQEHVDYRQRERDASCQLGAFARPGRVHDPVPLGGNDRGHEVSELRVVIDDENRFSAHTASCGTTAPTTPSSSARTSPTNSASETRPFVRYRVSPRVSASRSARDTSDPE